MKITETTIYKNWKILACKKYIREIGNFYFAPINLSQIIRINSNDKI